ncbi:hypothetical protein PPYR_14764 [Photinus pyralis]|uniref:Uncharacterized protein n=1 Tax=Photinus pyralis TaxID=7054 RepID=A0A5N4A662_PHOPY|nr:cuticle protein 64-like [Photinus pyralis]KAB0792805.1 hypothetical protein PPYR_14764 [Photinus pyralis]
MSLKIALLLAAAVAVAQGGYLEPSLRLAALPAPVHYESYVSPAVTKTDFLPGSYSSSYRSDVITPRVRYTETPGYSYSVPQPPAIGYTPTITKVAEFARVAPVIAPAPIARVGYAHGLGYAGAAPLALGHGFGYGGHGFGFNKYAHF